MTKTITLAAAIAALSSLAHGVTVLSSGHTDVGVGYESPKTFDMHVHSHLTDEEYEPSEVLLFLGENTRVLRPAGSEYDFLGVPAGAQYWQLPETDEPDMLFLGLGTEEMDPNEADFAPYVETDPRVSGAAPFRWITVSVLGKRGPGDIAGFRYGDDAPLVWYSSVDGFDATDKMIVKAGSHMHLNWAFTAAGLYELDLQASTYFDENQNGVFDAGDSLLRSDVATYQFGVEAVPEPATLAALGTGVIALLRRRRKG